MSDLTDNGTVVNLDELMSVARSNSDPSNAIQRNKALKESASIVTAAASSEGSNVNMGAAIKQWRSLCHLTVINVAIVTKVRMDKLNPKCSIGTMALCRESRRTSHDIYFPKLCLNPPHTAILTQQRDHLCVSLRFS